MSRYAAFLRGINVAGRKATSEQLRSCFEGIGCEDVATFRASGNVVFSAVGATGPLTTRIEWALKESLGYESAAFVRTAAEIRVIAKHDPFDARAVEKSQGKLQVVLLAAKPAAGVAQQVRALQTDDDLFAVRGRELYWLPSAGLMDSAVGMDGITKTIGPNTMRTKGTLDQLAAKFF